MTDTAPPPGCDWLAGRALLEHHARTGRPFDANTVRAELRDLGFSRFTSGRLFQLVEADGLIRQTGVERSTDRPTRGAFVRRWIGTCTKPRRDDTVTVPVTRDSDGRFTHRATFTDVPLFDVAEASR